MDLRKTVRIRHESFYNHFPLAASRLYSTEWYYRRHKMPPEDPFVEHLKRFGKLPVYYSHLSGSIFYHKDDWGKNLDFQKRFLQ